MNFRVDEADFQLETLLEDLSLYQWGSLTAKDYFCPICGILPFRRPSHPTANEIISGTKLFTGRAINVRCLDDLDLSDLPQKMIYGSKLQPWKSEFMETVAKGVGSLAPSVQSRSKKGLR